MPQNDEFPTYGDSGRPEVVSWANDPRSSLKPTDESQMSSSPTLVSEEHSLRARTFHRLQQVKEWPGDNSDVDSRDIHASNGRDAGPKSVLGKPDREEEKDGKQEMRELRQEIVALRKTLK